MPETASTDQEHRQQSQQSSAGEHRSRHREPRFGTAGGADCNLKDAGVEFRSIEPGIRRKRIDRSDGRECVVLREGVAARRRRRCNGAEGRQNCNRESKFQNDCTTKKWSEAGNFSEKRETPNPVKNWAF